MNRCISHSSSVQALETYAPAHRLLAVGEQKRSGVILCKEHYAEFAGPGAAINCAMTQNYTLILAIGAPDIVPVETHEERQKAYSRRIQWVRWLHKIVSYSDPLQRTEKLLSGFEEFFGSEILARIPIEVLGLLAGVLPQTIAMVQSESQPSAISGSLSAFSDDLNVSILRLDSQLFHTIPFKAPVYRSLSLESFTLALPCSA
ncbi:hypothetical protein [Leptodesmis sp.]|uniref:hypothetical protein n=1 Tax=Leptodesmis sp. TaxID=3100501 RepID=UPI0040535112